MDQQTIAAEVGAYYDRAMYFFDRKNMQINYTVLVQWIDDTRKILELLGDTGRFKIEMRTHEQYKKDPDEFFFLVQLIVNRAVNMISLSDYNPTRKPYTAADVLAKVSKPQPTAA